VHDEGHSQEARLETYLPTLWSRRRTILLYALAGGLLTVLISFLIPPTYQAVTTVIPAIAPDKFTGMAGLTASLEDFGIQTGAKGGNSPMMYPEIVKSRRVLEQVLFRAYPAGPERRPARVIDLIQSGENGPKRVELAVKQLKRRVDATLDRRTGVLTIRVRAHQPEVAAGIANSLDTLLQDFAIYSFTSQAGENRKFVEGRVAEVRGELNQAEENLRGFRERNLRIGNAPGLLLEEGRLNRSVREQEEVYLTLRRQYELAKIEERRDVPVINVLDSAVVPSFRISPRRAIMGILGLVIGGTLGAISALLRKP
jgi:uncharacterized protein involved in exopolysaccharide biosynthesis